MSCDSLSVPLMPSCHKGLDSHQKPRDAGKAEES